MVVLQRKHATNIETESILYFAYSLHMDDTALKRMCIKIHSFESAILYGYQLAFNVLEDEHFLFERSGLINIMPQAGATVEGIVYQMDECDLPKLDSISGVKQLKYYRKFVSINSQEQKDLTAYTYVAWPDMTSHGLLPTRVYLNKMIHLANKNQLSNENMDWLKGHPTTG